MAALLVRAMGGPPLVRVAPSGHVVRPQPPSNPQPPGGCFGKYPPGEGHPPRGVWSGRSWVPSGADPEAFGFGFCMPLGSLCDQITMEPWCRSDRPGIPFRPGLRSALGSVQERPYFEIRSEVESFVIRSEKNLAAKKNVSPLVGLFLLVTICHFLSFFVIFCHDLSFFVTICHGSFFVIFCHDLSRLVTTCHDLSRLVTGHDLSRLVTSCHDLSRLVTGARARRVQPPSVTRRMGVCQATVV